VSDFFSFMNNIQLINKEGSPTPFPGPGKATLLYFSAHWCGPCRQFTPMLKIFHEFAMQGHAELEIIFVSSDRSDRDMMEYYNSAHGSWLAVPFFSQQRQFLSNHFGVRGIPSLILLNRGTWQAVEFEVRGLIQQVAMMRNSVRAAEVVSEMRERSGALLFESIPKSLATCTLAVDQREAILDLLGKLVSNLADHPTESRYRQVKTDNVTIRKTILELFPNGQPLNAINFFITSDSFTYRSSHMDPRTMNLILSNRKTNGLSQLCSTSTTASPLVTAPSIPSPPTVMEAKFSISFRNKDIVETDPMSFESLDVLKAVVESVTDVPSEHQKIVCGVLANQGILDTVGSDEVLQTQFEIAINSGTESFKLLVIGQQTKVNPVSIGSYFDDKAANQSASDLRSKITQFKESISHSVPVAKIFNSAIHCQIYEVPSHQKKALECVPLWDIHNDAIERGQSHTYEEALFVSLLDWFKTKFFRWVDKPRCCQCQSVSTSLVNGKSPPTTEEAKGMANVVELFSCDTCGSITRFPRFNHPVALLHTREGRCGEWSNCFMLIARSVGFETRLVYDSADHVWCEVWMDSREEWVHCDPCENAYDKPLLYETGWGKQATLTIAIGKDVVIDVTKRYTMDYEGFLKRARTLGGIGGTSTPTSASQALVGLNNLLQSHWASGEDTLKKLKQRYLAEELLLVELSSTAGIARRSLALDKSMGGRTSGSEEWVTSRGEQGSVFIGNDNDDIKKSSNHGGHHIDTIPFSDEHFIRKSTEGSGIPRLRKISLWETTKGGQYVSGIACVWQSGDTSSHLAGTASGTDPISTLELESGEYVASVLIRTGALVDYIRVETNVGRCISAGNPETGAAVTDEKFRVPADMQVVGFAGGMGGHIHNISLLMAPIGNEETDEENDGNEKDDIEDDELVTQIFTQLVGGGMDPAQAAVESVRRARDKTKQ
jgi:thiol-disulfide isomerase/thioredoxin